MIEEIYNVEVYQEGNIMSNIKMFLQMFIYLSFGRLSKDNVKLSLLDWQNAIFL